MSDLEEIVVEQICGQCGKVRTVEPDYSPLQVIIVGQRIGWYSGEKDGELCPDCMAALLNLGNRTDVHKPWTPEAGS